VRERKLPPRELLLSGGDWRYARSTTPDMVILRAAAVSLLFHIGIHALQPLSLSLSLLSPLSPRPLQACIPTCSRDGIALPQAATLPAGFLPSRGNWESWDAWRLAGTAGGTHALCGGAGCRAGRLASSPVNLGSTSLVLTCHSPVFSVQQLAWCVYVHHLFLLVCSA